MTAYKTLPAGDDFDVVLDMYRWSSPFARDGKKVVQHNVYDFEQGSGYVFAFETKRGSNDERRVFVSTDDAQSFAPAIFPGAGRVNSIRVVDASEGMVFAVAQHTVSALRGGEDQEYHVNPVCPCTTVFRCVYDFPCFFDCRGVFTRQPSVQRHPLSFLSVPQTFR